MAVRLEDILELRKKIEADRKKLEEQEQALLVLEQMLRGQSPDPVPAAAPVSAQPEASPSRPRLWDTQEPLIKLDELPVASQADRRTLLEDVKDIVGRFGDQEFTVPHVEAALKQQGRMVNGKSPRARIAMMLSVLEERRILVRTYKGTGSMPHRFRLVGTKNGESPSGANTEALDLA